MRRRRRTAWTSLSCLKEADARKRLVCLVVYYDWHERYCASKKQTPESVWYAPDGESGARQSWGPQRSRRPKASGMNAIVEGLRLDVFASKKQTPESVWYPLPFVRVWSPSVASKKQTPESVWYPRPAFRSPARRSFLKEADARKRLVRTTSPATGVSHSLPQRSRRPKASGMRCGGTALIRCP